MHFIKDPGTGKRVGRMNPPEQRVIESVPEPRIVDQARWDLVQTRLAGIRTSAGAGLLR